MPRLHERDRLILELLENGPLSNKEISSKLAERGIQYHHRSVQHRMPKLQQQGHPIVRLRDTSNRQRHLWKLKSDTAVVSSHEDINQLKDYQALAIALAERYWSISALPERKQSLSKLGSQAREQLEGSDSPEARWFRKARAVEPSHWLRAPHLNEAIFSTIRSAVIREQALKIYYQQHTHDKPEATIVSPLGIFYRGRVAYLIAYLHERKTIRNRPISRIVKVSEPLSVNYEEPKGFNIDNYLWEQAESITYGKPFRLKALIFDSVQREIEHAHLGDNQVVSQWEGADQRFKVLEVDVPYTLDLIQWLLARAAYLKVLEPNGFRKKFEEEVKRMVYNVNHVEPFVPRTRNFGS